MKLGKQLRRTTFVLRFVSFEGSGFRYVFTYVLGSWPLAVTDNERT